MTKLIFYENSIQCISMLQTVNVGMKESLINIVYVMDIQCD